jgi:hypothetical protein
MNESQDKFQVISISLDDIKTRFNRRSDQETKATLTALDETARHCCEKLLKARMGSDSFAEFLKCPQPDLDDRTGHDLICNSPTLLLERLAAMEGGEG